MHNACKRYGLQVLQKLIKEFYIKEVKWSTHEKALRQIRAKVFIHEQKVPESLEWDGFDHNAIHLIAIDKQLAIVGCARILSTGHIGRMAVLKEKRGIGIGKKLLTKAINICEDSGLKIVQLSSQNHAITFYKQFGFNVCSDVYLDANIWHVDMQLVI